MLDFFSCFLFCLVQFVADEIIFAGWGYCLVLLSVISKFFYQNKNTFSIKAPSKASQKSLQTSHIPVKIPINFKEFPKYFTKDQNINVHWSKTKQCGAFYVEKKENFPPWKWKICSHKFQKIKNMRFLWYFFPFLLFLLGFFFTHCIFI